jgi:rubrerythrin
MRQGTQPKADSTQAARPAALDRLLRPLHRWVWSDARRRAAKLLRFAEREVDGGRDLARAAELTRDALLRRLYLRHAQDEARHAELFRRRGRELYASVAPSGAAFEANWLAPGERGLDDLRVEDQSDAEVLAFLHLSEKAAAGRFALYRDVLADAATREVFSDVLQDEAFHMSYTHKQLARIEPRPGGRLWRARASRFWKAYLRVALAAASAIGTLFLLAQYFVLLPLFALLAKRSARRELPGFTPARRNVPLQSQY